MSGNKIKDADLIEVAKLTQLKELNPENNPDLIKAQIDELQKALPNCEILSNPKKQPPNAPPASTASCIPQSAPVRSQ